MEIGYTPEQEAFRTELREYYFSMVHPDARHLSHANAVRGFR